MSFSFNFLPTDDEDSNQEPNAPTQPSPPAALETDRPERESHFRWLDQEEVDGSLNEIASNHGQLEKASHILRLSSSSPEETIDNSAKSLSMLRQVQEDAVSSSSAAQQLSHNHTDLIPGVYEGGLKVWECSLDLCRYLFEHDVALQGHVLELGCGHGLPACWALKRALRDFPSQSDCWVTFSDYNAFVLKDVTLKNVWLNASDANGGDATTRELAQWLSQHTAFGAGDWNAMSRLLLTPEETTMPAALPKDGLFDCILAAETTYSESAAMETAELIAKHLRPNTGVAYVATKRYYFGVRGGTNCLVDALNNYSGNKQLDIQVVEEYDNGVGNIRDLVRIQRRSS